MQITNYKETHVMGYIFFDKLITNAQRKMKRHNNYMLPFQIIFQSQFAVYRYGNMPIQIYRKLHLQKTENFLTKTLIFF